MLSLITFLPMVFALLLVVIPSPRALKGVAFSGSGLVFLLSLNLLFKFDKSTADLQFVEMISWMPSWGINYFLGLDGISLWLVLLTTFLTPLTILGSWKAIESKERGFLVSILALESAMVGSFLAMDAVLFYIFFEASLIPMYFIIGIWGGPRRLYATLKFFIYTMAGSLFMLAGIIALMLMTAEVNGGQMSASLLDFYRMNIPFVAGDFFSTQTLLFFAFCLAFSIKVPLFPFHTWLPDAHVEAPTPGSVILAGVMLKMGTYGFLRFVIPLFSEAAEYWSWIFLMLAVFSIIYGALVAMVQPDMKKLVAYSSVSHMGYVILGLFTFNQIGSTGALYQMLNHGISTGALFFLVGMVYERTHSREISRYGGLAGVAPWYSIVFVVITLSSIAVPLTNGFVGEYLILLGAYLSNPVFAYFAVLGVILGAAYMLWMVLKVFFGEKGALVTKYGSGLEMSVREALVMAPLILLVFWMGLFPGQFLAYSKESLSHLEKNRNNYELRVGVDRKGPRKVADGGLKNGD